MCKICVSRMRSGEHLGSSYHRILGKWAILPLVDMPHTSIINDCWIYMTILKKYMWTYKDTIMFCIEGVQWQSQQTFFHDLVRLVSPCGRLSVSTRAYFMAALIAAPSGVTCSIRPYGHKASQCTPDGGRNPKLVSWNNEQMDLNKVNHSLCKWENYIQRSQILFARWRHAWRFGLR